MYCAGWSLPRTSGAIASASDGQKGRQRSRYLTAALMRSAMPGVPGQPRMLRPPRARGPNSMRPWNHPTGCPWASRAAVSPGTSWSWRSRRPVRCSAARRQSAEVYAGPRKTSHRGAISSPAALAAKVAAPRAVPASPAAGCTNSRCTSGRARMRWLSFTLSAPPPAKASCPQLPSTSPRWRSISARHVSS